jgi:hypothetical protein
MARTKSKPAELTPEQEALAELIFQRIQAKAHDEVRDMVRMMAAQPDDKIFGEGEFKLRDMLFEFGASLLEQTANERAKKGVPR